MMSFILVTGEIGRTSGPGTGMAGIGEGVAATSGRLYAGIEVRWCRGSGYRKGANQAEFGRRTSGRRGRCRKGNDYLKKKKRNSVKYSCK